jgi:predicted nucleic acid-binding protein
MGAKRTLVFDASPLNHFARAGELANLRLLVADFDAVTTPPVLGELRLGVAEHPAIADALTLDWIRVVHCDQLNEVYLFSQYMNRLGVAERNAGEASVLAWAESNGATAYVDDKEGCRAGRERGVPVNRTLQLIIAAYRSGRLDQAAAQKLVTALAEVDTRFPALARTDLFGWAGTRNPPLL